MSVSPAATALSSRSPGFRQPVQRALGFAGTLLSFGTDRLVRRGAGWLKRNGLIRYVVPLLLLNEGFGAYRAYVAGSAIGWW